MYVPYVPFIRQEEDPSLAINYVILIGTNKSNIIAKPGSSAGSAMPTANAATCANGTVGIVVRVEVARERGAARDLYL